MKTVETHHSLTSSFAVSANFGLSTNALDQDHLMDVLRNQIYTDKVMAVLREYSANAWDAHRQVGKGDVPIKVTLPTSMDPTLTIKDYGPGLSHEDAFHVYTQYGASTKRQNDNTVGNLGLGCKSGFAYSDLFTVTSCFGSVKRIYTAALDETNAGKFVLISEEVIDENQTGIEIKIPCKLEDIHEFNKKALKLFQFFDPRPIINLVLPSVPEAQTVLVNGTIHPTTDLNGASWVARMGCIPYRIDITQLPANEISPCLPHISGVLNFEIGDVQFSASREELKYSTRTKQALINKFNDLIDEYVLASLKLLESGNLTDWDKRLRVAVLCELKLPLPEEWAAWGTSWTTLKHDEGQMSVSKNGNVTTRIVINKTTRILIDDTGKETAGYQLSDQDYIVRSKVLDVTTLTLALNDCLKEANLTGVTVQLLSTLAWVAPIKRGKNGREIYPREYNPKHRARMFAINPGRSNHRTPYGDSWEVVTRAPEPTDVFVVIKSFQADGYDSFFKDYSSDKEICKVLKLTMPVVYGYKTSDKKPVMAGDCIGVEYRTWREAFKISLLTPEHIELIQKYHWVIDDRYNTPEANELKGMIKGLGEAHAVTQIFIKSKQTTKQLEGMRDGIALLIDLFDAPGSDESKNPYSYNFSEAHNHRQSIHANYPLLKSDRHYRMLWKADRYNSSNDGSKDIQEAWIEYVLMVDQLKALATSTLKKKSTKSNGTQVHADS